MCAAHLRARFGLVNPRNGKSTGFLFLGDCRSFGQSGFACYLCAQVWTEQSGWRLQDSPGGRDLHQRLHPQIQNTYVARTKKKGTNTERRAHEHTQQQRHKRTTKNNKLTTNTTENVNTNFPLLSPPPLTLLSSLLLPKKARNPNTPEKEIEGMDLQAKYAKVVFCARDCLCKYNKVGIARQDDVLAFQMVPSARS